MKRGPRNPLSDGLVDERLVFGSCGQVSYIKGEKMQYSAKW